MKVCVVGNDWKQQLPLLNYGGIESAFENLCFGLNKYFKDEVKFCAFVPKIINTRSFYDFKIIETNFIESSISNLPPLVFGAEVKDLISRGSVKPDVIWCYSAWSAKSLYKLNIPIICTIMDSGGWVENKFVNSPHVFYKFCSKFIFDLVFKDASTNPEIQKIKNQSFWCYNGVCDNEYIYEENKQDYILWVAGLNWKFADKGLDIFIKLAQNRPDKTFVAYGTGDIQLEESLRKLSRKINNFEYLGPLERGEKHKTVFKQAKMFAFLTQITEAFGMTGLEAITKGTPVLGSTKGAVPELYSPTGICTDNMNEMQYALDKKFNSNDIFEYSKKFHIKNEIQTMINFSKNII
jgi:glycosyltransferase involved in cell wall biosynthesis